MLQSEEHAANERLVGNMPDTECLGLYHIGVK